MGSGYIFSYMATITIGIGEYKIVKCPDMIETHSLGSCVGVVLYDEVLKVCGMAHIMLPCYKKGMDISNPNKYADLAIKSMLSDLIAIGSEPRNIVAKIAGGACMFEGAGISENMQIGYKNVLAVKEILEALNIQIVAQDCGQNYGRTIEFHPATGKLFVISVARGVKEL